MYILPGQRPPGFLFFFSKGVDRSGLSLECCFVALLFLFDYFFLLFVCLFGPRFDESGCTGLFYIGLYAIVVIRFDALVVVHSFSYGTGFCVGLYRQQQQQQQPWWRQRQNVGWCKSWRVVQELAMYNVDGIHIYTVELYPRVVRVSIAWLVPPKMARVERRLPRLVWCF